MTPDTKCRIARPALGADQSVMTRAKREEYVAQTVLDPSLRSIARTDNPIGIPLTAFTLVTVPEDSMLSVYLRSREAVDTSMETRMSSHEGRPSPSCGNSDPTEQSPQRLHDNDDAAIVKDRATGKEQSASNSSMELELDKFMATLTATVSPDAIIRTITSTKGIKLQATRETSQTKT
ncbi:hypothetical protein FOPE_12537 [Fonsecaea pedrosoi]|nr:hypothetical protein FOPE_12537 [Fonsecaea pedrosoi]